MNQTCVIQKQAKAEPGDQQRLKIIMALYQSVAVNGHYCYHYNYNLNPWIRSVIVLRSCGRETKGCRR